MKYGYTFSKGYADWLGLDWKDCVVNLQQKFSFELVRLPLYWKDIEKKQNQFDWCKIDQQWDFLRTKNLEVVPCVGVRQPRWPEWYAPAYTIGMSKENLQERILVFLERFVDRYKEVSNLDFVQLENEPFEYQWGVGSQDMRDFLESELNFLRENLPHKKLILTYPYKPWSPKIPFGPNFNMDIVGVDLYTKAYLRWKKFGLTLDAKNLEGLIKRQIIQQIKEYSQDFWVTELQAEPWADQDLKNLHNYQQFMNAEIFSRNLELAQLYNPKVILVWGVEWWFYRQVIDQYTNILTKFTK